MTDEQNAAHETQDGYGAPPPPETPGTNAAVRGRTDGRISRRRRRTYLIGAGVLLLALMAGTAVGLAAQDDEAEDRGDRNPFDRAVASLAEAKGVRYQEAAIGGYSERDITVTASGKKFGSAGFGEKLSSLEDDVLQIAQKTYTRAKKAPDYEKDALPPAEQNGPGRWEVGDSTIDETLDKYVSPKLLAAQLARSLGKVEQFPTVKTPPRTVAGVPALAVDTSVGRLVVSKAAPYRVLRIEPYKFSEITDRLKKDYEKGTVPSMPPQIDGGPLQGDETISEGLGLTPLAGPQADAMYDRLEGYVAKLGNAVDPSVDFTLKTAGDLDCGPGGCSVRESFAGKIVPRKKGERITTNQVTAVLTATVTINGKSAGRCTSPPTVVRFAGNVSNGNLSCHVPEAGPLYSAELARRKSEAERQANAMGRSVDYGVSMRAWAEIDAQAVAAGRAQELIDEVRGERGKSS
ncbi:hypothetical protein [Streptomyces sp. 840.1]|uniref:hypothetical protein n=1 Tax=Streptomyces sp. 840.1 TaxID=2485152 RepID=UPI0011CE19E2|nr:hypothetical protein [Streptomyces sp. 840.1]